MPTNLPLQNGLVAFWNLNEASGTRADSSGNFTLSENGGTIPSGNFAPQFNANQFAGPCALDTVGDRGLERTNGTDLRLTNNMTVTCWVKQTTIVFTHTILGKWFGETNGFEWTIQWNAIAANGFAAAYGYGPSSGGSQVVQAVSGTGSAGVDFVLGKWYFVVARFINTASANGFCQVRVFGSSYADGQWYNSLPAPSPVITGVSRFCIGARDSSAGVIGTSNLTGAICNVGIWNRLLNDGECGDLWNGGYAVDYPFTTP